MKLRSYDKKYALHPVSQIRAMAAYAAPEVERVRQREAYLRRPQRLQAVEVPLKLPSKTDTNNAAAMGRGESLASLGPRLKQVGFLATMGLYPPDDELDLDSWTANRLRELSFKGPSTLENWMKIGPTAREAALNTETKMIEAEQQKREGNDAYNLENADFAKQFLAIEPNLTNDDEPLTTKARRRNAKKVLEAKLAFKSGPEVEQLRSASTRPAALAARLAILDQSNEGRRKPMGLVEVSQPSLVEEPDDPPITIQPRPLPPPFDNDELQ